jgi:hypothetical protein
VRSTERPVHPVRSVVVIRWVVLAISLVPTAVFLSIALRRVGYPYELEWLEGGAVEIVRRVTDGRSIYVQPSLHYVPYPYTPLYFWVSGALAHVTGVSFLPLRLVSLASSLGSCALLIVIVRRETGDLVAGVVASGLFTATFEISGAWLDIGRVDSLALLLLLFSFYVARRVKGVGGGILLGVLAFLAFMTKQSDLIAAAPTLVLLVLLKWRAGVTALVTVLCLVVGSTMLLNAATHGWYGYYVFSELTHQGVQSSVWVTFFTQDLCHVPWAIGVAVLGLVMGIRTRDSVMRSAWLFWLVATAGLVGSSYISRLHSGGGRDVLIPAYAGVALLAALGYGTINRAAQQRDSSGRVNSWRPTLVGAGLALVVAIQIVALHYNVAQNLPTAADAAAGRSFVALVRRTPGTVIVANHPYYAALAGKGSWAQGEAVHDVMRAGRSAARRDLMTSINAFLKSSTPATIFSDDPRYALGAYSDPFFRLTQTKVFACRQCFYPVTDLKRRPSFRFVRKSVG